MSRLLVAIVLVLSACGGPQLADVEASQPAVATPEQPVEGRAALAAAEGEPHILWFWGAN